MLPFLLSAALSWGQVTIVSDGLNNATTLFTLTSGLYYNGNSTVGDRPASSPFASEGTHSRGVSNASATLLSSNINTTSYTSVFMSFKLASFSIGSTGNGVDGGDIVTVEVSPDGGTSWYSTARILGNSNAYWVYSAAGSASTAYDGDATPVDFQPSGGGSRTTDGYSTVSVTGLPSVANLKFKITLLNNDVKESWVLDDFKVQGTLSCTAPTITANPGDQTICAGSLTSFTVATSAGSPSYQWEMSANGSTGWTNVVSGTPSGVTYSNATTAVLDVTGSSAVSQYYYRAKVTAGGCDGLSSFAKLIINAPASFATQPTAQAVTEPLTANFTIVASGAGTTYQWQVSTDGGGSWNNVSTGSGGTTLSYTTAATTVVMNGYLYRCVVNTPSPCSNSITSNSVGLDVAMGPCVDENFNSFTGASFGSWNATGMSIYNTAGSSGLAANSAQFNDAGDVLLSPTFTNATELSFWIKGNGTDSASALLVEGYNGSTWVTIQNITNSLPTTGTTKTYNASSTPALPVNLTRFRFTYTKSSGNLAFDDVKVYCGTPVAPCTTPTTQPTALNFSGTTSSASNGSYSIAAVPGATGYLVVYSTNSVLSASDLPSDGVTYTVGTAVGDGAVAYVGTGTAFSLSGLSSSTTYYVFVFAYNSGSCAIAYNTVSPLAGSVTTMAAYCTSNGNTLFKTSVTNVTLNTINNTSAKPSGYSDYTAISTNLQQGVSYPLSAKINTDGNYTILAFAWIDFNHDMDFNDVGEAFDLGSVNNMASGLTSSSPLAITVPLTAVVGPTRMRVIATYEGDSSSCLTGFDGEVEDYTVNIIAACVPTHAVAGFAPTSGPAGTEVIIAGTGFTTGTTVMFNGISAAVTYVNSTTIVATVPAGQTTGAITVMEAGCKIGTASDFTEIKQTGTCSAGNNLTDLIISETYDSVGGNSWYVELFNPTGSSIDLNALGANYKIVRYGDIGTTNGLRSVDISGVIPAGGVYIADLGSDSSCDPMTYNYINKGNGINENDEIRLTKNDVTVDIVNCPNEKGYVIRRNAAAVGPSASYNAGDWTSLLTETCANLGTVPFSFTNNMPTVNTNPSDATICGTTASFTILATPSGAGVLTYQWFYNNGVASGWTAVAAGSFVGVTASGFNSGSLYLNGTIVNLNGYQFYCQVTQGGTCSVASDAAQLKVNSTTWNGTAWSNGVPVLTKLAVINGNYNTATNGDFECCSLIINSPFMLDIKDTDYVLIQNDLTVNGTLEVQNQGSLVMVSDDGVVTNNGTTTVRKMSTPFDRYDYTFWSSPIGNAPVSVFSQWQANRIYKLNTSVYRDDNNDSHDDNMDAWVLTPQAEIMSPGRGYAVMGKINQAYPAQQGSVYNGVVNNGLITQSIALSLDNTKANDDFNLIGNPYPSAISADAFILANPDISGTLYFWTHEGNIQVAAINPGPMAMNFSPDDFAYYNLVGGTGTRAGLLSGNGNSNAPNGFVASGQGFQVDADAATSVIFNNSMRNKTYVNTNFYKTVSGPTEKDRLWLNLTNSEGIFNQQLIGFFPQATMGVDRGYDGFYSKSPTYAAFYSIIDGKPYKIQGRSAFDVNDRVPLGFRSVYEKTYSIAIGDVEGVLRNQNVYIEDLQLHIIHDLKLSNYVFSTPAGEFNNRFVLRFANATLGNADFETNVDSVLVYANEGINVSSSSERIKDVFVYDVLGRLVAERKEVNTTSVSLQNVRKTQGALLVKVVLDNGQTTTKKVLY
ncbi:hypothetical protein FEDK69T_11510 [Flavobacterium enshiense DK69]|nr:hypothetical protein FEDK69T_11510 [Flavobacterium enshiense DK69]